MERGNLGEAKQLAKNVIDNQDKINHHGKRAEAIVKGMLNTPGPAAAKRTDRY
jgi:hypothetical protein